MFIHCIHCARDLGRNESLEAFPVGKRIAYDPAKGRLWVVCPHCERWNLSPLEERWEAMEDAERQFRAARLRASTDQIGLAHLRSGLDLVRIGSPLRPEMAAWRYGDQFGRRRWRQLMVTGTLVGSASALLAGVAYIGVGIGSMAGIYANGGLWDSLIHGRPKTVVARIRMPDGHVREVQRRHARMSVLEHTAPDAPMQLRVEHVGGTDVLRGADAQRVAQQLLPTVNRFGGSKNRVQDAVRLLEDVGDPALVASRLQHRLGARDADKRWKRKRNRWGDSATVSKIPGALHTLPLHDRLALEMALHEDSERRAMEESLAELERAWQDAEMVAAIADNLLVPSAVEQALLEQRRARDGAASDA